MSDFSVFNQNLKSTSILVAKIPPFSGHRLLLKITQGHLSGMEFIPEEQSLPDVADPKGIDNGVFILKQFQNYFENPLLKWDVPLLWPKVSTYQKRICEFLQTIPSAKTISYGEIAKQLNSGAQAVGNACRKNPFPIIIPCHRVVARNGIGGYSGDTGSKQQGKTNKLNIKRFLLEHEKKFSE